MNLSRYPHSLFDQSFGLCISPHDLIFPSHNYPGTNYYRPWQWYLQRAEKDFGSTIHNEKNNFKITLDMQHFQPNEINVKVADREVIIEGKHEERQDNYGFISRQFKRRYLLPGDCNADSVVSSLSSDGILTVTAEKVKESKTKEITVPIKMCDSCPNKPKLEKEKVDDSKKEESASSKKNMEIMLKEDHCCLLKPELLGAPSTGATQKISMETKKEVDELTRSRGETSGQATSTKAKEKIDDACAQGIRTKTEIESASAAIKSEMCNIKSSVQESITIQESSTSSTSMASSIKETSEKISEIVSDISAQLKEAAENI
ncbi:protein lethal(2)essential for life-like [Ostrinia nubilalis]|uniref:protein lethal(2)essential for life-like n=1 Tax=Ostrinia nubilalis TaxID=29057 RepID=UPI003082542C